MNRFIVAMGVELEGAWRSRNLLDRLGYNRHHDGSVAVSCAPLDEDSPDWEPDDEVFMGEVVSPAISSASALERFIRSAHPTASNRTCGFHVHFSFANIACYCMLMDSGFQSFFLERMKAWGAKSLVLGKWDTEQFIARLAGRSDYCKREWYPDAQVGHKRKTYARYTQWNFCYGVHGTAECRLLPMFESVDTCCKAVAELRDCVTEWLEMQHQRPAIELSEKAELDPDTLQADRTVLPVQILN